MDLRVISKARVRSSKKTAASSNEPPPSVSTFFPEKDVKDYRRYGSRGSPSPGRTRSEDSSSKYGYGNGNPTSEVASKHGCADCGSSTTPSKTPPRRSSVKQGRKTGRRATIGYTGEIEVKLPGRRNSVRRRTSISFSGEIEVREVERVSSLTDNPNALWFQQDELENIKTKLRTIIATLGERGDGNPRKLCTRGLERHILGKLTKTKINAAWDAVVIEQYIQQNEGSFDDESISNRYKVFARGSQEKAAERAKKDEAAIAKYQRDTRRMMIGMSIL
jgi:hypothetical protein